MYFLNIIICYIFRKNDTFNEKMHKQISSNLLTYGKLLCRVIISIKTVSDWIFKLFFNSIF